MSDISIPGVNNSYDKLVEALMKKERIPRDREAENLERLKLQNESWLQINRLALEVRDIARNLYSFNNPFAEKIVESSNERSITATASRSAKDQTVKLTVIQTAESDKFLSSEIPDDLEIQKGKYTFTIGEKKISIDWKGGKYKNFVTSLKNKAGKILDITEIKITPKTKALLFASSVTGEKNKLKFEDDALQLALDLNLIKKNDSSSIKPSQSYLEALPETSSKINFSDTVKAKNQYVMELKVTVTNYNKQNSAATNASTDTGNFSTEKIYEQIGSISYKGITIQNELSHDGLEPNIFATDSNLLPQKNETSKEDNMNILSLESVRGILQPLPPLQNTEAEQTITIPLAEYGDVKSLSINNTNANKTVKIESINIYDPKAVGDYIPVNAVSSAQDAIINFEGIQIKRETNEIDDLIPGATLYVHEPSEKKETITVKPDVEAVKNSLIEFVAKYNRFISQINILTQKQPEIIQELTYLSNEEVEDAEKKLGLMYGNNTLINMNGSLRQIMSQPYKFSEDTKVFILSHMGISTKTDKSSSVDMSRLRGYLEIDEKLLDEVLNSNMESVKSFFGFDSDGDMIIDSGLAHTIYEQINPYTQRGGIFAIQTDALKNRIAASQKNIDNYDKKLAIKEQELRRKYGSLEGTLKQLQKQSQSIENFNKQSQNK